MSRQNTRRLGMASRIYKNSSGKILGVDDIEIVGDTQVLKDRTFHKYVDSINVKRTLMHLETGGDRTISEIQMIGDYTSLDETSGNFYTLYWAGKNLDENNLIVSIEHYISSLGDVI